MSCDVSITSITRYDYAQVRDFGSGFKERSRSDAGEGSDAEPVREGAERRALETYIRDAQKARGQAGSALEWNWERLTRGLPAQSAGGE